MLSHFKLGGRETEVVILYHLYSTISRDHVTVRGYVKSHLHDNQTVIKQQWSTTHYAWHYAWYL